LILGGIPYIFYILANICPLPSLIYISAAPLFNTVALYLNRIGRYHAYHKEKKEDVSVSLFFGIYCALQGSSLIWGNMISYFVLNQSNPPAKEHCGIDFNPQMHGVATHTEIVNQTTVRIHF
jgi:hypothetical protein